MQALLIGAAIALVMCGVGIVFRKKDVFKMVNHPLIKKHPYISKTELPQIVRTVQKRAPGRKD